jgi:gliding motility-associated-like protein
MRSKATWVLILFSVFQFQLLLAGVQNSGQKEIEESFKNQPVLFTENIGQMADKEGNVLSNVLFRVATPGTNLYVTKQGLTYFFLEKDSTTSNSKNGSFRLLSETENVKIKWQRVDMSLSGAQIKVENVVKEGVSNSITNYFLENCPNGIYNVHSYEKLVIKEIYPGIDWVLYNSNKNGFKYDFVVHPNANPSDIAIVYGADAPVKIQKNGSLKISEALTEDAPYTYQNDKMVKSKFKLVAVEEDSRGGYSSTISFEFSNYTKDEYLIIDPQLVWCTLFGGNDTDYTRSITTDAIGNVFISGITLSTIFPLFNPGLGAYYNGTYNASFDAFVAKFNINGSLVWSTLYGGSDADHFISICSDPAGNLFVLGNSDSFNFPVYNPGGGAYFQNPIFAPVGTPGGDIILCKFSNTGQRLWATAFAGNSNDFGYKINCDSNGNVFIVGATASANIPLLNPGGGAYYQAPITGQYGDMLLLKFNNNGVLIWSTLYGGNDFDLPTGMDVDDNGNVFITGYTISTNFPTFNPGGGAYYDGTYNGGSLSSLNGDVFILKFDNNGVRKWGTYYGGSLTDNGWDIKADNLGNVIVTGGTDSPNFPLLNPGPPAFFQGTISGSEGFILKFTNSGVRKWATFYGGNGGEALGPIAIDKCNNFYVGGGIQNTTNMMNMIPDCNGGFYDNFMALGYHKSVLIKFGANNSINWSTYGLSCGVFDPFNNMYSLGADVLINPGGGAYFDNSLGGLQDGAISKLSVNGNYNNTITSSSSGCGCMGTATLNSSSLCASSFSYLWEDASGMTISNAQMANGLCPGTYNGIIMDTINCYSDTLTTTITASSFTASSNIISMSCGSLATGSLGVSVNGGFPPYSYNWSPSGGTDSVASNLIAGTYSVIVSDQSGCVDTINAVLDASPIPNADIAGELSICQGETIILTATGGENCLWSTGDTAQFITVNPSTNSNFSVIISNGDCSDTANFNLIVHPLPALTITPYYSIMQGDSIQLFATGSGLFSWTPSNTLNCVNCSDPIATPQETTNYCVTVSDNNDCLSTSCVLVSVQIPASIFIPNAFTPDANGLNDVFRPQLNEVHDYTMLIFNRWGEKLFESTSVDQGWNGFYKGHLCEQDVYVYKITYFENINNSFQEKIGDITLLR